MNAKIAASILVLSLTLPSPALALRIRNAGMEEKTHITRKLQRALEPSAGAEEENILEYQRRLEALGDRELAALAREEAQSLTDEERLAALGKDARWLTVLIETLEG